MRLNKESKIRFKFLIVRISNMVKVKPEWVEEWKKRIEKGKISSIARAYGVDEATVHYHVYPDKRKKAIEKTRKFQKKRDLARRQRLLLFLAQRFKNRDLIYRIRSSHVKISS